jgi:CRP/FNR family transcriptional regulator, cyclic AMP receptor protein
VSYGRRSPPRKKDQAKKIAPSQLFDPKLFLTTMGPGRQISKYSKKDVIFAQGEDADAVFYITRGKVKLTVLSSEGKEGIVALLGSSEFLGEGCLIGQPKRMATASAMTDCEAMRVEKTEVQRVLHDELEFSKIFLSHVLLRNARVEEDLVDQLFNSTEKRLARTLLLLARYGKQDQPQRVLPKMSQEMLATMIGTSRSRVNLFMNKFKKLGFIKYNGGLQINSSLLSVVLHD